MKRLAALALAALLAGPLSAQEGHRGPPGHPGPPPGHPAPPPGHRVPPPPAVFDGRYRHDHYYPVPGYVAPALPFGSVGVTFGNGQFFFHGGVWYRPYGPRFRVVLPPIGIIVPVLPPSYVTLWIGAAPFYYANGVYYAPASGGYAVVEPPPGADTATPVPPAPPPRPLPEPIYYPRNGQSPAQTETDRRACNQWAAQQPGATADPSIYDRALGACMDGRGYTAR